MPELSKTQSAGVRLAQFSLCPCCGTFRIPVVSDAPIRVQVGDGRQQIIKRSQAAQLVRFLARVRPAMVVTDHMYQALGRCIEVTRVIDTLRKRGIPIVCESVLKRTKPGTYGLYALGDHVRVWEPDEEEAKNHVA